MANLSIDPKYGIASDDYDSRVAAVSMYKRANKIEIDLSCRIVINYIHVRLCSCYWML